MSSFFSRLKNVVGSSFTTTTGAITNSQRDDSGLDDYETVDADEFLIVGKTNSAQDAAFDRVAGGESHGFSMFLTCSTSSYRQTAPSTTNSMQSSTTQHSSVRDIPLSMNPLLTEKDRICRMLDLLDLEAQKFDWAKYLYDFGFEQKVLRELNIRDSV